MSEPNPLDILGIDAAVLEGLSSEQARLLVGERKRILSTIFHPDLARDEDSHNRIVEINKAASELQVAAIFDESLRALLAREARRKKKTDVQPLSDKLAIFGETLIRLIEARGGVFQKPQDGTEEKRPIRHAALPNSIGFRPYVCLISAVMPQIIGRHMDEFGRANISPTRYELRMPAVGEATLQRLKASGPFRMNQLTREQKNGWNFRQGQHVYLWVGSAEPVPLEETIIGTVDQTAVDRRLHEVACEEFAKKRATLSARQEMALFASYKWYRQLIRYPTGQLDLREAEEGYPLEKIESFLPFYDAYLVAGNLILSVLTGRSEQPLYRIMGTLDSYRSLE